MREVEVKVRFPEKIKPIFQPFRYKILYGGRGGGKSWSVARALIVMAAQQKMRILCAREFQNSIGDSVHKLLGDQIVDLNMSPFYEVLQTSIKCKKTGSEFLFSGIRHNASKLKSFEGLTHCWVEEAQNVTKSSWEILIPTMRTEGSEIWVTFNPEFAEDETYKRFVLASPTNGFVEKVNWSDNPWFPEVLKQEMEDLRKRDPDSFLHIWEGHCRQILEGAVYANELRSAQSNGNITKVPHLPTFPVSVFADIGWADNTSLWFIQKSGFEYRAIRAYQNRQQPWIHYLQHMQSLGYLYDTVYLPHDAQAHEVGSGRTVEEITRKAGYKVQIVPRLSIEDGINAARTIFPIVYFDETNCADGLHALRRYRFDVDTSSGQWSRKPLHDDSSHFADAFRYFAVGMTERPSKNTVTVGTRKTVSLQLGGSQRASWMK